MAVENCGVVVEKLGENRFRAFCPTLLDCEAVATTEDAARQTVEAVLSRIMSERRVVLEMNPIDALFQKLRASRQKAFMPFITAGDPSVEVTTRLIAELARQGAGMVEVGIPYSDPIADGPVIQASYTRSLARGIKLKDIFDGIVKFTSSAEYATNPVPLVCMVAFAIIHRQGPEAFVVNALRAGFSGAIIPDLPVEEAGAMSRLAAERNFKIIQLVTPTTPRERAVEIAKVSTGFLYYVSITGITGERDRLPRELIEQLRWLRTQTELPICVGFGISKPEQVRLLRDVADGVIVGSALVRQLEKIEGRSLDEVVKEIGALAGSLANALNS